MSQKGMANYFEELRRQNSEARKDAFAFTGVAYYNYNSIVRYRQGIERIILAEKEETMEKIQEIIQNLMSKLNYKNIILLFLTIYTYDYKSNSN